MVSDPRKCSVGDTKTLEGAMDTTRRGKDLLGARAWLGSAIVLHALTVQGVPVGSPTVESEIRELEARAFSSEARDPGCVSRALPAHLRDSLARYSARPGDAGSRGASGELRGFRMKEIARSLEAGWGATDLVAQGRFFYVGTFGGGITTYDLSDPMNPREVSYNPAPSECLALDGNLLVNQQAHHTLLYELLPSSPLIYSTGRPPTSD